MEWGEREGGGVEWREREGGGWNGERERNMG